MDSVYADYVERLARFTADLVSDDFHHVAQGRICGDVYVTYMFNPDSPSGYLSSTVIDVNRETTELVNTQAKRAQPSKW